MLVTLRSFVMTIPATIQVAGKTYDTLDAALAAIPPTGGTIDLGRGSLRVTSPLQVPAGVSLAGRTGASAEAVNVTLARNGVGAYVAGTMSLHSSRVVQNAAGLARIGQGVLTSRYNDVFANATANYQDLPAGTADLSVPVMFRSTADFHLAGLQQTTDMGDPNDGYALEPQPNGARVNLGAFGNTDGAELSEPTAG